MKRSVLVGILSLLILMLGASLAFAESESGDSRSVFNLHSTSLRIIHEDAFLDTAAEVIILPETLEVIEDGAFGSMKRLTDVYIPGTTQKIGDDAFRGASRLTVHGILGSRAQDWAKERGFTFVYEDIWSSESAAFGPGFREGAERFTRDGKLRREIIEHGALVDRQEGEGKTQRPQERPELHAIDYRFP